MFGGDCDDSETYAYAKCAFIDVGIIFYNGSQ
jgi:hypothetical protein